MFCPTKFPGLCVYSPEQGSMLTEDNKGMQITVRSSHLEILLWHMPQHLLRHGPHQLCACLRLPRSFLGKRRKRRESTALFTNPRNPQTQISKPETLLQPLLSSPRLLKQSRGCAGHHFCKSLCPFLYLSNYGAEIVGCSKIRDVFA